MFEKQGDDNNESGDEGAQGEPEEPIYAEDKDKIKFKEGVKVEKSPYTNVFKKNVSMFKIKTPAD